MTLYVKNSDGTFTLVDPTIEAQLRADPNNLFSNDGGHDVQLSASDAAAIRAQWAANTAATQAPNAFSAAISLGVAITSTGTPALNAAYPCGPAAIQALQFEALYVLSTGSTSFSNGTNTVNWPDVTGTTHQFSPSSFMALFRATMRYLTVCRIALAAQTAMPSNAATIT